MRTNWWKERRLDFVEDRLVEQGRANRRDIVEQFGVAFSQASADLMRYAALNPAVIYDNQERTYRWKDGARRKPVRGSTPQRRKVWAMFRAGPPPEPYYRPKPKGKPKGP